MKFETIILDTEGGMGWIRLNRPQVLNAVNTQLVKDLGSALEEVDSDPGVRVVVITGEGRAFSTGADLKAPPLPTMLEMRQHILRIQKLTTKISGMNKPVIAAVNGYALGAGCELALCCDIRIASERAKFGFPEAAVGLFQSNGVTQILPRLVGIAKAKELVFTYDIVDGKEAERIGLVNKVVPHNELEKAVREMANKIMDKAPLSIALAKACINKGAETDLETALVYEIEGMIATTMSEDSKEGARAFQEGRKPVFKGK